MPAPRMTMRKAREILRLRWGVGLAGRAVARSCNVSPSTVSDCVLRASLAGLSWPLPDTLDDAALEERLYPPDPGRQDRPEPDFSVVYRELRRKGVTIQLLWQEYKVEHGERGYQYSRYCELYRRWRKTLDVVMRQEHRAGEKLFVDYAGQLLDVTDPTSGEVTGMQVFVAAFGASNYTFADIHVAQDVRSWAEGHVAAFEFFGGVPAVLVPDNLKAGVRKPCFYDPDINPGYLDLANHYDTVVIPARVRKPRDKAKVENAVLQVERWVLAPLRKQVFFSLGDARRAVRAELVKLNNKPLTSLDGTRRTLFDELDKPALKPLPAQPYEPAVWKPGAAVNIDYHVQYDGNFYSAPHQLVRKRVDIRATDRVVEIVFKGQRVASHLRRYTKGKYYTEPAHRPASHQKHDWSPERLIKWAASFGPATAELVRQILQSRAHPEQGYRSCLGVLRLGKEYGADRLEAAAQRALDISAYSSSSVRSILKTGLDQTPIEQPATPVAVDHENIRGADYYH
jgi:transposase